MFNATQSGDTARFDGAVTFKLPSVATARNIRDKGAVRVGGFGPAFRRMPTDLNLNAHRADLADAGAVRVGGFGPLFRR